MCRSLIQPEHRVELCKLMCLHLRYKAVKFIITLVYASVITLCSFTVAAK